MPQALPGPSLRNSLQIKKKIEIVYRSQKQLYFNLRKKLKSIFHYLLKHPVTRVIARF